MHKLLLPALLLFFTANIFAQKKQSTADSLVIEGIYLHDEGKYKEALEKYEQALKLDKSHGHALYETCNTYVALKDYKQALKYADKVIEGKLEGYAEAYTLKGNVLDMQGKPEKAIEAYREGIKNAPPNAMLHFNLGVTLLKQDKSGEAATEFVNALKLNPSHRSSHYLLGMSYSGLGLKTKTLLPLYHFILLENEGKRTEASVQIIERTMSAGISKEGEQNFNVALNPAAMNDEFSTTETLLSFLPISDRLIEKQLADSLGLKIPELTLTQKLVKYNESFFKSLGEHKDKRPADTFWWDYYADFFAALQEKGHTEAFTNYLMLHSADKTAAEWLGANEAKLQAFADWIAEYQAGK
jgi:hypothetical protein